MSEQYWQCEICGGLQEAQDGTVRCSTHSTPMAFVGDKPATYDKIQARAREIAECQQLRLPHPNPLLVVGPVPPSVAPSPWAEGDALEARAKKGRAKAKRDLTSPEPG